MKSPYRPAFVLSLLFTAALIACLAIAGNIKKRPVESSAVRAKSAASQRARTKRIVNFPSLRAAVEQTHLPTGIRKPQSTVPRLPEAYDSPREAAEFFRLKRLPEGATELPIEKYFEARE